MGPTEQQLQHFERTSGWRIASMIQHGYIEIRDSSSDLSSRSGTHLALFLSCSPDAASNTICLPCMSIGINIIPVAHEDDVYCSGLFLVLT